MFDDEYAQTQRLFTKDMGIVGTPNADLGDVNIKILHDDFFKCKSVLLFFNFRPSEDLLR